MQTKPWIVAGFLVIGPATIVSANRSTLFPQIYRACENYVLSGDGGFAGMLAHNGISMRELCECQAPAFISRLSDTEVAALLRSLEITTEGQHTFTDAAEGCAYGLKRRPRAR
jgi:hypothetical protein